MPRFLTSNIMMYNYLWPWEWNDREVGIRDLNCVPFLMVKKWSCVFWCYYVFSLRKRKKRYFSFQFVDANARLSPSPNQTSWPCSLAQSQRESSITSMTLVFAPFLANKTLKKFKMRTQDTYKTLKKFKMRTLKILFLLACFQNLLVSHAPSSPPAIKILIRSSTHLLYS